MNLLPIIYTSLIIFTGFVIFIVTISYITYKIKEKNNTAIQAAPINLTANYVDRKPMQTKQVQNNYDYSYESAVRTMQTKQHEPEIIEESYSNHQSQYEEQQLSTQRTEMPKIYRDSYQPSTNIAVRHRTTSTKGNKSRFNILNNQPAFSGSEMPIGKTNFNLLNYYADDEDVHFPQTYSHAS